MTRHDPLVVERAVLKALTEGGLSPADCQALGADDAAEVGRRLIEIARSARAGGPMTAPLISERVRCAGCAAETSQATLDAAPTTMGWVEHDGFRLCADCAPSAQYIVALDRERNAHQVTLGKLEQLRERTITEERVREVVRSAATALLEERKLYVVKPQQPSMNDIVLEAYGHGRACDAVALQGDDLQAVLDAIADRAAKELAGAVVGLSTEDRAVVAAARCWRSAVCDRGPNCGDGYTYHDYDCPTNEAMRGLVNAVDRLPAAPLAAAFDRASRTITGQSAAALSAQLKPTAHTDTAIIDRALDLYSRTVLPAAELEVIARIRAALTGPVPS